MNVKFKIGLKANLPATGVEGSWYFCKDTGELYNCVSTDGSEDGSTGGKMVLINSVSAYGVCSTAAATVAKTVAVKGFVLATGSRVIVKFSNTNSATNATLNVNNTGAKLIYYRGAAITKSYLAANHTYEFVYNGTQWELIGDIDTNTTYTASSLGAVTAAKFNDGTAITKSGTTLVLPDYPSLVENATNAENANHATTADSADTAGQADVALSTTGTLTINGAEFNGSENLSVTTPNTTYSFTGGTNKFTVTPSGGTAQSVNITPSITVTANSSDDDVVNLTSTNGINAVTYTASHAKKGPTDGYVSNNETTSISGSGELGTIKIPQITVDSYGHVTAASDESVTITLPSVPSASSAIPKMDGTAAAGSDSTWSRADHVHPTDTSRAPVSHASSNTTYGAATTSNYGHVKISNGDADTVASASGLAAGMDHTHSTLASKSSLLTTVTLTGDVTGTGTVSGTGVSISTTVADDSHNHVISNVDGLQSVLDAKAPLASPTFTGTPKAPTAASGTNTTQIATTAFVQSAIDTKIAAADAMIYKGTIGTNGTVTELPSTTAKTGWTYKVITAGTYASAKCEVGDMIICLTDGSSTTAATWSVVQTNIDGAVTGPASSTNGAIALFDGTTGKVIKNSSYTPSSFATSDHKHSYTPSGTVGDTTAGGSVSSTFTGTAHNHSFTGTAVDSGEASDTATIYSITGVGSVPTRESKTVPTSGHTHAYTPAGTVASTFTGTAAEHNHTFTGTSATSGGPSGTTSVYSITGVGTLPSVTLPTVTTSYSAGTLTITHTAGSYTAGTLPTRSSVTVASSNHTHSVTAKGTVSDTEITPAGSVSSTFTGTAGTASATASGNTMTVYSITGVGTTPSRSKVTVPTADHTHEVTASGTISDKTATGTISSTFTGTAHNHSFTGTAGNTNTPS